jgi:hypothetical protein
MRVALRLTGLLLMGTASGLAGQVSDSTPLSPYKRSLIVLPFLTYAPETRWQFGAGGGMQFKWPSAARDSLTRPSYAFAALSYTTRGQWTAGGELLLYTPGDRWGFLGRFQGAYFPLTYYGIGPSTERADSNRMENRLIQVETKALRRITGRLSVGPYYRLHSFFDIDWQFPASIAPGTPGEAGGVSSGLGLSLQLDARNSTSTPSRGHLILVDYLRNASWLGSDFDYDYLVVDARAYLPIWGGRDVVALSLYGEFNGAEVPIQTMSMLSSATTQELMRGVYRGRFRDRHEVVFQADYRGHLKGRFGYVVFGSAGNVFGSGGSQLFDELKFTYGTGIRFNVNPRDPLNIRADFALTSFGETGFTLGFSEAF